MGAEELRGTRAAQARPVCAGGGGGATSAGGRAGAAAGGRSRPSRTSSACEQRQAGQFADAQAAYERALALDPNYADAERNLAILHDLYLDNPSAALPHFERYQLLTQGADTQVTAWVTELRRESPP